MHVEIPANNFKYRSIVISNDGFLENQTPML